MEKMLVIRKRCIWNCFLGNNIKYRRINCYKNINCTIKRFFKILINKQNKKIKS